MFDSLRAMAGKVVVPVVYRATLLLMSECYEKEASGLNIAAQAAEEDRVLQGQLKTGDSGNPVSKLESLIAKETNRVLQEIEREEGKPVELLTSAEVNKYVTLLADVATSHAARSFTGLSVSGSDAKDLLVRLRKEYR